MSELAKKWYVVRTQGGKEHKAKEYIEKEIQMRHIENMVSQVLVPTEKYFQIKNGKRVSAERIFYPGYILVEAAMTAEIESVIRNVTYVAGFLSETSTGKTADKRPVPLRDSEVDRILGRVDELVDQEAETVVPFVVGEAVKIVDGPFKGFDGTVSELLEDKKKLRVTVKIFGRESLVDLNFAQVTKE